MDTIDRILVSAAMLLIGSGVLLLNHDTGKRLTALEHKQPAITAPAPDYVSTAQRVLASGDDVLLCHDGARVVVVRMKREYLKWK